MPRATKAQLASANVAVLPNAAPRQVDNYRYAGQRRAVKAARAASPWPGDFRWPSDRQREEEDRLYAELNRSPELLIVMTMVELMTAEQQQRLAAKVDLYAAVIDDEASAAAALVTRRLAKAASRREAQS